MDFTVEFYETKAGTCPVREFLDELKVSDPDDFAAEVAGLAKLRSRHYHREPLSKALGDGTIQFTSEVTAEFMYSPALEFFAKLGDSIADEHDEKVREQERSLAQEFLDAFVKDYNNARPGILALDNEPALTK